uniref:Proline dehydrogenase n=1 Tax=Chlamydomonas euryale TaxID=1486919 RepID=A0A7R9VEV4_9CHLO|mmetsp:Transcript_32402/g.96750  ORF Transcript_32402/g.96750 Transcript_32402/m.96750 type:complete len:639 (+) Transcript_32402:263-2179(+)
MLPSLAAMSGAAPVLLQQAAPALSRLGPGLLTLRGGGMHNLPQHPAAMRSVPARSAMPLALIAAQQLHGSAALSKPVGAASAMREEPEHAMPMEPPNNGMSFRNHEDVFKGKSTAELVRAYMVFKVCSIEPFVRHAGTLLSLSHRVLGHTATDFMVKHTFFKHFCAGETPEEVYVAMNKLRESGVSAILDYAAEDDMAENTPAVSNTMTTEPAEADFKEGLESGTTPTPLVRYKVSVRSYNYASEKQCDSHVETFLKAVDAAGGLPGQGFAALKVTALGNPTLLERCSNAIRLVQQMFRNIDTDGNGYIDKDEFLRAYNTVFPHEADEERERAFAHFDADEDGKVPYEEWCNGLRLRFLPRVAESIHKAYSKTDIDHNWLGDLNRVCLDHEEIQLLDAMVARLETIVKRAVEKNVKLMVDAEHTYFQPAIDHLTLHMMQQYNKYGKAHVYNTYQCYLTDSEPRLRNDIARAKAKGYTFAAKLVRGAYMSLERLRAQKMGYESPVWPDVESTHACYNSCMEAVVQEVANGRAEVMIASHNEASIQKCVAHMARLGLQPGKAPVYFGQLLGMADHLTFTLGKHGYPAFKYVPYGRVAEVVPYLLRRAQENASIMKGAKADVQMLTAELARRFGLRKASSL